VLGATGAATSTTALGSSGDDDGDVGVSVDELHGQRIHAWVLVRAGRRGVTEHIFVEPSTGATYPVHASPYLSVEGAWNSRNYWVNMQAQPVLPRQPLGEGSQLSEAVAARLAASGSGAATPSGGDGRRSASASGSRRYDRSKSPSATGTRNAGRFYFGGPGTPGGGGGSSGAAGARAEEGASAGAGASAAGIPAKLRGPYAASLDLPGVAARGLPAGAPVLGAAALDLALGKRPPLRGELAHRAGVSDEAAAAVPGSAAGAAPSSAGGLRGRAAAAAAGDDSAAGSRAASRSRSRGHVKPGSSDGWRRDLAATQAALQAQVAQILLAQAAAVRGMDRMGYDFGNESDWEVVMIPSEPAAARGGEDGAEEGGEGGGLGSGSGSGSGSGGGGGLRAGGRSGFSGERKDGSSDADEGAGEGTGRGGGGGGAGGAAGSGGGGLGEGQPGVERDGEHVLDLPQSWVPRLVSGGKPRRSRRSEGARSLA
jgi:hypothetical protein